MNPHSENHTTHTLAQNYAQRRTCTMRFLTENLSILLNIYSTSQSFPVAQPEVTWFTIIEWKSQNSKFCEHFFSRRYPERAQDTVMNNSSFNCCLRGCFTVYCNSCYAKRLLKSEALQRMCKIDTFCRIAWYWGDRVGWLVEVELYGGGGDAAEWRGGWVDVVELAATGVGG